MSKHVFILGAGASVEAGGPLMRDFLDRAEDLMRGGDVDRAAFQQVFDAIAQLQSVHSKATLDILNVESVFGAFEMADLFGRLGSMERGAVTKLRNAITTLIVQTVEALVRFPVESRRDQFVVVPPQCYTAFVSRVIARLEGSETARQTSIITFNYDLGIDHALHFARFGPEYSLTERTEATHVSLLKLHGSVNWTKSGSDNSILVAPIERILRDLIIAHRTDDVPLRVSRNLGTLAGGGTAGIPFIVPPTWSKLGHYTLIEPVWRQAAEHLSDAENVYVLGFSLAESDQFFRLLYALGTVGSARLRRFWVFDPSPSVEGRFKDLLGEAARARFEFFPLRFGQATERLVERLKLQPR